MTTALSQMLRDTLLLFDAQLKPSQAAFDSLRKCIAKAEAMDKLAYFEARVKPSSDDPEAQAGWLSDEVIKEITQRYSDHTMTRAYPTARAIGYAEALRYARDHGYLKPSQAIGEQTPVAYTSETALEELKMRNCGNMSPQSKGFDTVALYRSPISPEARDMAVEALEQARTYIGNTHLIIQALSALRGS